MQNMGPVIYNWDAEKYLLSEGNKYQELSSSEGDEGQIIRYIWGK